MDTEKLKKLRERLPSGYLAKLNSSTGFSEGYISQVLNGDRDNCQILDAAILLAHETQRAKQRREKQIANL